jgi:uncharacterized protein YndB with AHSA1/START domain
MSIIKFDAEVTSAAPPDRMYAVLTDLPGHRQWAGTESKASGFSILTLDAPTDPATVGTRFTSTGDNAPFGVFHDSSIVTAAEAPGLFAFETDSRLVRSRRPEWHAHFTHRYEITPEGSGSRVRYTCELTQKSYTPLWLLPFSKPMTRVMVPRLMSKNLRNLARLAEKVPATEGQ